MELSQLCKSVKFIFIPASCSALCNKERKNQLNVTELGCPSTFSARIETVLEEENAEDTESE